MQTITFGRTANGFRAANLARLNDIPEIPRAILDSTEDFEAILPRLAEHFGIRDPDIMRFEMESDDHRIWNIIPIAYKGFRACMLGLDGDSISNNDGDIDFLGSIVSVPWVRYSGATATEFVGEFKRCVDVLIGCGWPAAPEA